jgi:hypothetical protein
MGGMGNQMFQYAAARALSLRHGVDFKLDRWFLDQKPRHASYVLRDYELGVFRIKESFAASSEIRRHRGALGQRRHHLWASSLLNELGIVKLYRERTPVFDTEVLHLPDGTFLEGHFQSPKYFDDFSDQIRREFAFKQELPPHSLDLLNAIESGPSLCLNVRRTDYLATPLHGVCGAEYYKSAYAWVAAKLGHARTYVFSDDLDWCRENLSFLPETVFVEHEHAGAKFEHYLQLMSRCKHFIIPNSTFGWWAAWLSTFPEKLVVAPKLWFAGTKDTRDDMMPQQWHRM